MAKNDSAVLMSVGYIGKKGGEVKRVEDPKKFAALMKKSFQSGIPTFTWRTVGLMGCPKCKRKVRIAYDPSKPVTCMECLVKAVDALPKLEPVMVKIGKGKNAQRVHSCSSDVVIEVPVEVKAKKK